MCHNNVKCVCEYLVCTQEYITMAESNVEKFLETSDLHYLYQCTKEELCEVGDTHQISLERKLKEEMQKELVEKLGMREPFITGGKIKLEGGPESQ